MFSIIVGDFTPAWEPQENNQYTVAVYKDYGGVKRALINLDSLRSSK